MKSASWDACEIQVVANGYVVMPSLRPERMNITSKDETFVFNDWSSCSRFLQEILKTHEDEGLA